MALPKELWKQCNEAADEYWQMYWPCQYTHEHWGRCGNGPHGHQHHQRRDKSGKPVGGKIVPGTHDPSHNSQELQDKFRHLVEEALSRLAPKSVDKLDGTPKSLEMISGIHLQEANAFYKKLGIVDDLVSHSTCLVCLDGIPEHCLPCGHVICSDCAKSSGECTGSGFVKLECCPLLKHRDQFWSESWIGCIKPRRAGLRILSLDG